MNRKDSIPESLAGEARNRDQIIIRTSVIGIAANLLLAAFKAAVGLVSHSIAVTLDAVNNLSDALSSVITIVGTKLANRQPDRKHPLGHGRVEYLSAMIVAAIVLYAGITAAVASVKKIIRPEKAEYTAVSLMIVAVAIGVKLLLGRFVTAQGRRANSRAMEASGADATFDAILSASVLASALIYVAFGVSLEAWVGAAISVFIIRSGIDMMTDTLDDILGQRADPELTGKIRRILTEAPDVRGAYDLLLNNYGPDRNYASVHLELPDTMTVEEVDVLTRNVQARVYQETGVVLTGVGVYSYNTKNSEAAKIRNAVQALVLSHEWALQMHGFYIDTVEKDLRFDVVMSFEIEQEEGLAILTKELKEHYPEYTIQIAPDVDIAD
ncbi:cation diffusion facilitator family transporter [Lachnoclostridium sp. Marseille-P6806]|uniref:cation diffusion facilitator family transporter n=1 Tax=Lachnoclostridium sp. Marseille-P6806 TaxID=2364793 RepID=UPI0010316452|nr:cation diffusion facilitator family transporter [Lachnoclostridium sp. Marseille-P6806]